MSENKERWKMTIALAGNPNCGKTTIFNALTGANQHVGNYSGVTVEKRNGSYFDGGYEVEVIDLPGTYSLHSHSPEERVAQDELLSGKIDVLVAIVDSGALSRSLIFVSQLMQLNLPMVLCLNMWDEAEKSGLKLDISAMSTLLGMPVIQTVGSRGKGIDALKKAILGHSKEQKTLEKLRLGDTLSESLNRIKAVLPASIGNPDWTATRLILGDEDFIAKVKEANGANAIRVAQDERNSIESTNQMDISMYVTERYYGFVDGMLKEVTVETQRPDARATSDRIDKIVVNRYLGIPIFLVIVFVLFQLTFTLGQPLMDLIEAGFGWLGDSVTSLLGEGPLQSLLVDGIIGGVGGVVVFLPNILILFLGLSFLEDCGYMARSAFLMDKLMHKVGLHGRSFIPLITGFGCSVPGLMATRTIAGEKERLTTMFVLPFISCGARLPIWLLLVPCFFPQKYWSVTMLGIYVLSVVVALLCAWILRKTVFKGQEEPFVMELPPYRMPTLRATLMHMWERGWLYLKKAGTIILAISIILWAMTYFPRMSEEEIAQKETEITKQIEREHPELAVAAVAKADGNVKAVDTAATGGEAEAGESELDKMVANEMADVELRNSFIGRLGLLLEPIVKPMGFNWKVSTAMIGAFAAKEVFVAQMGIVYSMGDEVETEESLDEVNGDEDDSASMKLRDKIRSEFDPLTGVCMIIFLLLTAPCMATFAVMKRESNSWKMAIAQYLGFTLIAYVLAVLVQQIGRLFM